MKNRYGQDGMTYNIKMNTNNGQIEFLEETSAADLLDDDSNTSGVDRATVNKIFEKI